MSFARQLWYVAAWSDEIAGTSLVNRTLLNEHVLLFRTPTGHLHAISDVCPHRLAPLHLGKHCGDSVACGYHGLRFDGTGRCVENPHQAGNIPAALRVKSYPSAERNGIVWIWMGDPASADVNAIPAFDFVDTAPSNAKSKGYLYVACNFELLTDNIMDLSHVDVLHSTTLGTGAIVGIKPKVTSEGHAIRIRWWSPSTTPNAIFARYLPQPQDPADQWVEVVWQPPAIMTLENGATSVGAEPSAGVNTMSLHLMTPETELTTHYFFLNSRDFDTDNAELNSMASKFLASVFSGEDKPMIEGQQRYLGSPDLWAGNPVMLGIDQAPVLCRRVLQKIIGEERRALEPKSAAQVLG